MKNRQIKRYYIKYKFRQNFGNIFRPTNIPEVGFWQFDWTPKISYLGMKIRIWVWPQSAYLKFLVQVGNLFFNAEFLLVFLSSASGRVIPERSKRPLLTSPLVTRGEICPPGAMFTPSFTRRGEHSKLFRRMEGRTDIFTPRG
jgi:hypothetical protein